MSISAPIRVLLVLALAGAGPPLGRSSGARHADDAVLSLHQKIVEGMEDVADANTRIHIKINGAAKSAAENPTIVSPDALEKAQKDLAAAQKEFAEAREDAEKAAQVVMARENTTQLALATCTTEKKKIENYLEAKDAALSKCTLDLSQKSDDLHVAEANLSKCESTLEQKDGKLKDSLAVAASSTATSQAVVDHLSNCTRDLSEKEAGLKKTETLLGECAAEKATLGASLSNATRDLAEKHAEIKTEGAELQKKGAELSSCTADRAARAEEALKNATFFAACTAEKNAQGEALQKCTADLEQCTAEVPDAKACAVKLEAAIAYVGNSTYSTLNFTQPPDGCHGDTVCELEKKVAEIEEVLRKAQAFHDAVEDTLAKTKVTLAQAYTAKYHHLQNATQDIVDKMQQNNMSMPGEDQLPEEDQHGNPTTAPHVPEIEEVLEPAELQTSHDALVAAGADALLQNVSLVQPPQFRGARTVHVDGAARLATALQQALPRRIG